MRLTRVALLCLPALLFTAGCPQPVSDPCEAVQCGAGRCVPSNGEAVCICDTTYVAQGLKCIAVTQVDPCASNPCAATGKLCTPSGNQAVCACPSGFSDQGGSCVKTNPCTATTCADAHHVCVAENNQASCVCAPGYAVVGTGCSADPVFDCSKKHSGSASDDQYEPNECPELATPYDLAGSAQSHTLTPAGDEDWLKISPSVGRIVALEFTGSNVPLYVDVYGQDGLTPVAADHRGVNTPSLRFVAGNGAQHYVRVRALRANDTGSYTVTMTDQGNDDYVNLAANALSVSPGSSFTGQIQYEGDEDVLKVNLTSGRTYRLQLATSTANGIQVQVIGQDGATVRKTLDTALTVNQSHLLFASTNAPITLRAKAEQPSGVGPFSVAIEDLGADDHGDLVVDATVLNPSANTLSGNFETRTVTGAPVDNDVFTFAVQAGHIYAFTCSAGTYTRSCSMSMRDQNGTVVASHLGGSSTVSARTITAEASSAGTWTVTAAPYSGTSTYLGAWTIKLEDLGADDFGDNQANAATLTVGTGKTGNIEVAGDLDYFGFSATAARIYRVGCTASTSLTYCAIRVLDAAGTLLGSSSYGDYVTFEAAATATYYVEVKAYYAGYVGGYTLTVTDLGTDDHGDSAAAATALTLGSPRAGVIEMGGDVDFFSVTTTANDIYNVSCTSASSYLCYLTIRDPSGTTVTTTTYGTSVTTGFRATTSGTYTIAVRGYYSSEVGSYTLTVSSGGSDDHSDTATGATALTLGTATAGSLQFSGDKDVFSFSATSGKIYKAACTTSASYLCVLSVKNSGGTVVASSSYGTATSATFLAATTGTFTVETNGYYSTETGSYTLTVTDEGTDDHANTSTGATALTVGTAQAGSIQFNGDRDVFSFSGTANHIYKVSCTSSDSYLCPLLVKSGATTVSSATYGSATSASFEASTTGTFHVETYAYYSGYTGSYSITVTDEGTDDHGDTALAATAITAGATATAGKLEMAYDIDVFSFTASAGKLYRFTCTTSAYGLCQLNAKNPSGTSVGSTGDGYASELTFKAAVNGAYAVEVNAWSTYTGSYTVQLFDDGTDDFGDTVADATLVAVPGTTSGSIQFSGDKDVLKFNASLDRIYKLACTSTGSYGCRMIVRDASGVTVSSSSYGTTVNLSFKAASAGVFTVELGTYYTGYTGTWSLGITETSDDHSDTTTNATVISTGTQVSGQIDYGGDYDYFAVTLTASQTYTLTTSGTITRYTAVYDPAGTLRLSDSSLSSRSYTPTVSGVHHIRVRSSSTGIGSYTLTVQ